MSIELLLESSSASGPLTPSRFAQALAVRAKVDLALDRHPPKAGMRGQELRVAVRLSLEDGSAAGFLLDFAGQGARVRGTAYGPSAAALRWSFHLLASQLKCRLRDVRASEDLEPSPDEHRPAAKVYLEAYEADVVATRRSNVLDGAAFVAWLAREELIALSGEPSGVLEGVSLDDAPAIYELLLESGAVEDVFVSERELATFLARFRARAPRA